jgi:DNA/RNA-binding domain of Phe-tRNA-synthetase-like protein
MLTIGDSVRALYPGAKMGILAVKDVSHSSFLTDQEITEYLNYLSQKYAHFERKELKELYPINAYIAYYKKFGSNYHLLAQLESVIKGHKTVTFDSGLLQAMFLSEMDDMLLTAGHDLVKLQLPLQLKTATGTEIYQSISGKEVAAVEGDLMVFDSNGPLSSILKGPDFKSRITPSATAVLFKVYAPPGIDEGYIENNLRKLEKRIKALSPLSNTELLQVFS